MRPAGPAGSAASSLEEASAQASVLASAGPWAAELAGPVEEEVAGWARLAASVGPAAGGEAPAASAPSAAGASGTAAGSLEEEEPRSYKLGMEKFFLYFRINIDVADFLIHLSPCLERGQTHKNNTDNISVYTPTAKLYMNHLAAFTYLITFTSPIDTIYYCPRTK